MSDIYLSLTETPTVVTLSQPVVSGVLASNVTVTNVVSVNVVTMPAITVQAAAPAVTTVAGTVAVSTMPAISISSVTVSNFPASQVVSVSNLPAATTVTGTVALDANSLSALENVTVTVGAAVTVAGFSTSSLPPSTVTVANTVTVNGTVTANADLTSSLEALNNYANYYDAAWPIKYSNTHGGDPLPISGTVTANVEPQRYDSYMGEPILPMGWATADGDAVLSFNLVTQQNPLPISGTVTVGNSVTISSLPAINGTVTVGSSVTIGAMPNGALTTRFGTPVTANTAFATSCVTNTSRKYLLIQNVTTGSNVITVGIGFTPTTTQGIQLTAGAGITFESSYIPTGAVQILSSVTASNFTILEA